MMNREIIYRSRARALLSVALGSFLLLAISMTIVHAQATYPGEDGALRQRGVTLVGQYDIVVNGAGLEGLTDNSLSLTVPGTRIVAAYLYWSGIQLEGSADDPNVMLQVDAAAATPVTAATVYGPSFWYEDVVNNKKFFHNTYVADVSDIVTDTVALGTHTYTFSGYTVDADVESETYGFSLLVVYESLSLSSSEITLLDGLDSVYKGFPTPRNGLSAVNCITFAPDNGKSRALDAALIASGVSDAAEGYRPNNLYFFTGTGTPPAGDIVGLAGVVVVADPFSSADGSQIDTFETEFTVPVGADYACFQTESVNSDNPKGASFIWQVGAFSLQDQAPNAISLQSLTAVSPSNLLLLITGLAGLLFLAVPTAVVIANRRRQE